MKTLLLLMLCVAVQAAVSEDFTLTDGRTMTGTYDEDTHQLTLTGGKCSLAVLPEQIKDRAPTKVTDVLNPDPDAPITTKSMTPEEKAAALEGFNKKKQEDAAASLKMQIDRAEKEIDQLTEKAAAYRMKAKECAKSFTERAKAEHEYFTENDVMRNPTTTKKLGTSNASILKLLDDAKKLEQKARDLREKIRNTRQDNKMSADDHERFTPVP